MLLRRKVYAKQVQNGDMKAADAEHRIAVMAEIADHYLELAQQDDERGLRFPDSYGPQ